MNIEQQQTSASYVKYTTAMLLILVGITTISLVTSNLDSSESGQKKFLRDNSTEVAQPAPADIPTFTSIVTSATESESTMMETIMRDPVQSEYFTQWLGEGATSLPDAGAEEAPAIQNNQLIPTSHFRIAEVFPQQSDFATGPKYGVTPWIEFKNYGVQAATIKNWKLRSVQNGWVVTITPPPSGVVPGYPQGDYSEYYVLCTDKETFDAIYSNMPFSPNLLDCDLEIPGPITPGDTYILKNNLGVVVQQITMNTPLTPGNPRSIDLTSSGAQSLSPVPYGRPGYRLRLGDANESQNLQWNTGVTATDYNITQSQLLQQPQTPPTPAPLLPYQIPTIRGWQNVAAIAPDRGALSIFDAVGLSACLILENNCSMVDWSLQQ